MNSLSDQVYALLLAGAITGLLVPALMRFIDLRLTAAAAARKAGRDRQLELLERLTKVVWQWRFNAKQVAYYGAGLAENRNDRTRFDAAAAKYEATVWEQFAEVKAIRSAFLVRLDDQASDEVEALYRFMKEDVDVRLTTLVEAERSGAPAARSAHEFHQLSTWFTDEVTERMERHLRALAVSIRQ